MELRKKMEEIYLKLNGLGEESVLRKSPVDRKEEYRSIRREEEIKRIEEAEKKTKGGNNAGATVTKTGLFATQV